MCLFLFSTHFLNLLNIYTSNIPGTSDVWFSLRNTTYQNNSIVTLEDIGEGDTALLCETNFTACCRPSHTGIKKLALGRWIFPNETIVASSGEQWDFHRTRGQMVAHLNRRRGGEEGIFRCEIPDSTNLTQTIYIGVYTASNGDQHCLYTPDYTLVSSPDPTLSRGETVW